MNQRLRAKRQMRLAASGETELYLNNRSVNAQVWAMNWPRGIQKPALSAEAKRVEMWCVNQVKQRRKGAK